MKKINYLVLSIVAFSAFSCSDDDNNAAAILPVNEEEVITTVTTTLTNGSNTITLTSRDLDGDGPTAPVITTTGNLLANTNYTGKVSFLNEISTPAENITDEIQEEGDEHQIFFQPLPANLGTFTYTDADVNGKPIGLTFTLTTGVAATGNLIVTLRHEPNKSAAGVSDGAILNASGSTDAEVVYPIIVQ